MPTVTYKNQPGIHKTRGNIPLAGTSHVYRVKGILWPEAVEAYLQEQLIGRTLHICCGKSQLGDVRLDLFEEDVDIKADANRLPFADLSFDTVLIDPPYNGKFQWNHDMLNELHRLAMIRIVFQHWFSPVNKNGQFKKAHVFELVELGSVVVEEVDDSVPFDLVDGVAWQPRTYFGRMQFISIMDRRVGYEEK